ncbi:NAD-dependent epimerase/dehydratase family protein [Noviherbaspirillum sedimenti]|nr:NAD-dependent epimerase/dehydratase family protein [Noviherbaspirillum sedimenti]
MKALVLGATGYVGSAVARTLKERGMLVHGLARNAANREKLEAAGVVPIEGNLEDLARLTELSQPFDVVVMAAMVPFEAEAGIMRALIAAQGQFHRHLLFTSGTGVLAIEAKDGAWNQNTFAEDDPFPFPSRYNRDIRLKTENLVREASSSSLSTYVIRPPLIYGNGASVQIPQIFESVRKTGDACYLGYGLNLYSCVHVDDLAEVYALAIEKGTPGALYHAVSGEANFRTIAEAVAEVAGCGTRSLSYEESCSLWGGFWVDIALAVNSRSIAKRTIAELGWVPRHFDIISDIRSGSYFRRYRESPEGTDHAFSWTSHG